MSGFQNILQQITDSKLRQREQNKLLRLIDEKYGEKSKTKAPEEKLTIKQQILLMEALGILNMEKIKMLPVSKQAIVLSALLNRGEKSVKDHLTYLNKKEPHSEFFCRKNDNVEKVSEILKGAGISVISKK